MFKFLYFSFRYGYMLIDRVPHAIMIVLHLCSIKKFIILSAYVFNSSVVFSPYGKFLV